MGMANVYEQPSLVRCSSIHGQYRCQSEVEEHELPHWAQLVDEAAAIRWGVVEIGCYDPQCKEKPGHQLPHRDGRGCSWVPADEPIYRSG